MCRFEPPSRPKPSFRLSVVRFDRVEIFLNKSLYESDFVNNYAIRIPKIIDFQFVDKIISNQNS